MELPSLKEMLEAGVHFGHQTRGWNPKMRKFILSEHNGIHVINLKKTRETLEAAEKVVRKVAEAGKQVLFGGTKVTSRKVIQDVAGATGQFYVTKRWLGGMLTNYQTVRQSIRKLEKIEKMAKDGTYNELTKKEVLQLEKDRMGLAEVFDGIRSLKGLPSLIVITDVKYEHLAIREARKLRIPIIALCDTNVDPELVEYPVPANDDAVKSLSLILDYLTQSLLTKKQAKDQAAEGIELAQQEA